MTEIEKIIEHDLRELVQLIDMTSKKLIGPGDGPEMELLAVEILIWKIKSDFFISLISTLTIERDPDQEIDRMVRKVAKEIGFAYEG